jgi:hypothetical protein
MGDENAFYDKLTEEDSASEEEDTWGRRLTKQHTMFDPDCEADEYEYGADKVIRGPY